mmetsp:Transcript_113710/g.197600  ORF Transcript_113710/g.197600 Transcript_113710/m.197600 type:complete len:88 (-) Transcript_113710:504-767(-)
MPLKKCSSAFQTLIDGVQVPLFIIFVDAMHFAGRPQYQMPNSSATVAALPPYHLLLPYCLPPTTLTLMCPPPKTEKLLHLLQLVLLT